MPSVKKPTSLNVIHKLHVDHILSIQCYKVWPTLCVYWVIALLIATGFATSTTSIPQPSSGTWDVVAQSDPCP